VPQRGPAGAPGRVLVGVGPPDPGHPALQALCRCCLSPAACCRYAGAVLRPQQPCGIQQPLLRHQQCSWCSTGGVYAGAAAHAFVGRQCCPAALRARQVQRTRAQSRRHDGAPALCMHAVSGALFVQSMRLKLWCDGDGCCFVVRVWMAQRLWQTWGAISSCPALQSRRVLSSMLCVCGAVVAVSIAEPLAGIQSMPLLHGSSGSAVL